MSEQAGHCLRDFVEAVDSGEVDPCTASSIGCFVVKRNEIEEFNGKKVEYLVCDAGTCTAIATLKHEPGVPGIQTATCHDDNVLRCHTIGEDKEVLPRQTDETSCLPTATAYQLAKFGSTRSSEDIDVWLQRKPNEPPSPKGQTELNLAILKAGFSLERVYPKEISRLSDYYKEGSTLTYEDYVETALKYKNWKSIRDYFETTYTKEVFLQHMARCREDSKVFAEYEASGQLVYNYRDITPEYVAEKLKTHAIRAIVNYFDGKTDVQHAVVVEDVKSVRGGWVVGQYFCPDFEKPSRIMTKRARDMHRLFRLEYGLALIKPFVPEESAQE